MKHFLTLLLLMVVFLSFSFGAPKTYDLNWNPFNKGLKTVSKIHVQTQFIRYLLNRKGRRKRVVRQYKITQNFTVYWQVVEKKGKHVVISVFRRKGTLKLQMSKGRTKTYKAGPMLKRVRDPLIREYAAQIMGGYAYKMDVETGNVLGTWDFEEGKVRKDKKRKKNVVGYRRKFIGKDPYGITAGHWLVANKKVAVGYKWSRRQPGVYIEDLKFVKVQKAGKRKVAFIRRKGKNLSRGKKVGKIDGYMLFDIEAGLNYSTKDLRTFTRKMTIGQNKYAEDVIIMSASKLIASNHKKIK